MPDKVECKQCGNPGTGKYCNACGQSLQTSRITFHSVMHEVFHFFTHLDKGFLYTLRQLFSRPGKMQLEYIEGVRGRHQKPFSMFFISATAAAIFYYWINTWVLKYNKTGSAEEITFFNHYLVLLQIALLPVYSIINYFLFIKARYNYAEITVLMLYTFSIVLMFAAAVQPLKFIFRDMETRWVEVPLIVGYIVITKVNFFKKMNTWLVVFYSVIATILCFTVAAVTQDWIVEHLLKKH